MCDAATGQSPENSTIKAVYCLLIEARAREQQQQYIRMGLVLLLPLSM